MKLESFTLAVIFVIVSLSRGHIPGRQRSLKEIEPQVYCGRALPRILELICYGIPASETTIFEEGYQEHKTVWSWLLSHRVMGASFRSRLMRYIVNACCDKPSSVMKPSCC